MLILPRRAVLNICFPYTSRAEITTAIQNTVSEVLAPPPPKNTPFSQTRIKQNILSRQLNAHKRLPTIRDNSPEKQPHAETNGNGHEANGEADSPADDADEGASSSTTLLSDSPPHNARESSRLPSPESITVDTLDKHMYTADDPPLDLFVRTSGVERLSDFMLWQCHQDTQIFFLPCLWPDFDLHHFIWVLLEWQWRVKQTEREETPGRRRSSKPRKTMVD